MARFINVRIEIPEGLIAYVDYSNKKVDVVSGIAICDFRKQQIIDILLSDRHRNTKKANFFQLRYLRFEGTELSKEELIEELKQTAIRRLRGKIMEMKLRGMK